MRCLRSVGDGTAPSVIRKQSRPKRRRKHTHVMIDSTDKSTAASAPAPAAKKTPARGPFNQAQLRSLAKAESVGIAGQKTAHVGPLGAREISADYITTLLDDVTLARIKAHAAVNHTLDAKSATADETTAAYKLIGGLQEVQKAAKQKYGRKNRVALAAYLVGKKLNGSRPNLLQTSQSIVEKIGDDTLPGFTAAKIRGLTTLRTKWIEANGKQVDSRSASLTTRAELKTLLKSIDERRAAIQTAADAEWPHTDQENAGSRKDFALPVNRPLTA